MGQLEKLSASFGDCGATYAYADFVRLLRQLGYEALRPGKTSGSARKFYNKANDDLVILHEPHDGEMRPQMVRRLQDHLRGKGLL